MISIENACCFTGYRPEKFDFAFDETNKQYCDFISRLITAISTMINNNVTTFYTGMAKGFDIIAAEYVALIKKRNHNVKLIAVIPFKDQGLYFSKEWRERYDALLDSCDQVIILNDDYIKYAYAQRNRYMVDRCRHVITYYDGKKGGTENTIKYAVSHLREVLNIFDTDPLAEQKSHIKARHMLIPPDKDI